MTETSIGYGYDNRIQWMFFIAKHINNWSSGPIVISIFYFCFLTSRCGCGSYGSHTA